jgi:anti-sigma factor RsiW
MSGVLYRARFRRDHRWTPNHMSAYVDAELARGERGRMERHLDECGECRRLLAGLRATLDVLHRLPAPSGGAGTLQLVSAVRARLREPPAS